jgi:uncharacterized protein YjbI with pentapeptide repeats
MLQTLRGEGTSRDQIVWVMVEQMGKQATGQKQGRKPWTLREFGGQTVWDWLHLLSALAIPVVLAIVGLWFSAQQDARQQNIEDQRAEAERELAEQRAQGEALQAYLNQMSELMLNRNLLEAKEGDPVYTLAQARTSTVMTGLDAAHNRSVVRFLSNSGLLGSSRLQGPPSSTGSLLRGIGLEGADLSGLRTEGCISSACRPEDLLGAGLRNADLSNADLSNDDLFLADLRGADLSGADLTHTSLSGADLSDASLRRAYLGDANLSGANLSRANLSGAEGITNEELEQQAVSLKGATMPDGQKYGDWLKE